ncbi:LamG-like jellyroll fold domain-containing protein [Nonomuraea wenchangensis]|uniref:LamG-like jellyroll fold domain-containing protein n=1 Tax=Nonomuraea wenchangensis TaxID=568860 RepID=UPI001C42EF7D
MAFPGITRALLAGLLPAALTLSLTTGIAAAAAAPAPVLVYEFDADDVTTASITDSSGNGLHGELVNAATAALVDGAAGGHALSLPGGAPTSDGAYVRLPLAAIKDRTDLTVSARVKWDGTTSPWQWIYALGKDNSRYLFSTPYNGDGRLRTAVTTSGGGAEAQVTGYAPLPANAWKTLTVTLDTAAKRITTYLDGAAVASAPTTITAAQLIDASTTSAGFIGRSFYPDPLFDGAIDDFRVYAAALTPEQVAEVAGGTPPTPTGLGQNAFDVRTSIGTAPALPPAVRATFSDGYDRDLPITWPAVDPEKYAAARDVHRRGHGRRPPGHRPGHGDPRGPARHRPGQGHRRLPRRRVRHALRPVRARCADQQPHRGHEAAHRLDQGPGRPAASGGRRP